MKKLTTDQLFALLRHDTAGHFFSVRFRRRTDRRDGSASAGDIRHMLCRTAGTMVAYKDGVIDVATRDREDFRHAVLTVWDVNKYNENKQSGMSRDVAGRRAFRRIDVAGIVECSLVDKDELPQEIRLYMHDITNAFRLANLPKIQ